jgi:hypothetical protein
LPPLDESDDESNIPPLDVYYEEIMDPLINTDIILPEGECIALAHVREKGNVIMEDQGTWLSAVTF